MLSFSPGGEYSRANVKEAAGLPGNVKGGNWDTGIVEHEGEFIIFANVGTEGRTGHAYGDRWEGTRLRWYHKTGSHLAWPSVQRLLERDRAVHVFWRTSNTSPFAYAGRAAALEIANTTPVEILWSFDSSDPVSDQTIHSPEEIPFGLYLEGSTRQVVVNAYERDRTARDACIAHYGYACAVCGLQFEERYGALGVAFIHVHHVVPLSELGAGYLVDPVQDLRPVCPNCHAMLHRRRPPLSIEELRAALRGVDSA